MQTIIRQQYSAVLHFILWLKFSLRGKRRLPGQRLKFLQIVRLCACVSHRKHVKIVSTFFLVVVTSAWSERNGFGKVRVSAVLKHKQRWQVDNIYALQRHRGVDATPPGVHNVRFLCKQTLQRFQRFSSCGY